MKITKTQLKRIIVEELKETKRPRSQADTDRMDLERRGMQGPEYTDVMSKAELRRLNKQNQPPKPRKKKKSLEEDDQISQVTLDALKWGIKDAMKPGSGVAFDDVQKMMADYWSKRRAFDSEHATAAGMEQDIEMRQQRGEFEKGDYGISGHGSGEYSDYGEYPWIKAALENLKDEDHMSKEKAIQALAGELGVSIRTLK